MLVFEVRRHIAAKPANIWPILTNAAALQHPDFGITRIEGEINPGAKLKLWSDLSPDRAFPLRITELTPMKRMVWASKLPFGLFSGVRQFNLNESGGGTEFHMREEFSGLLSSVITNSIPDLNPSFERFADALQQRAEADAV